MAGEAVSMATFQREFELHDILDYIKTGIASVIEDEVTQRFVAEDLKVCLKGNPLSKCVSHLKFQLANLRRVGIC